MTDIRRALADLGLSESEIDVYLAMAEGADGARDIAKLTRRKRPTIYYALNALAQKGLVSKTAADGQQSAFRVEPLDALNGLAAENLRKAGALAGDIREMTARLGTKAAAERPQVSFFEGTEAVKRRIMYTLYNRERFIYSIVPKTNFFWQIGESFVKEYVEERVKKGIRTRNLWEATSHKATLDKYYKELSAVRLLPKEMKDMFTTTIFFYDDKTLYISSKKNSYCILVQSAEHCAMMKAFFEGIWAAARLV